MRITTVGEAFNAEWRKSDSVRKAEKSSKTRAAADKSEFSQSARRLSETKAQTETVSAQLVGQPDIRQDKIAEVKQKIDEGYYNTEEFADKLADKLIKDFGLGEQPV